MPIAYKFSFAIALLILVGMSVLGLFVLQSQREVMHAQIQAFGQTVVRQVAESAQDPVLTSDTLSLEVLTTNLVEDPTVVGALVLSAEGEVLAREGVNPFVWHGPLAGRLQTLLKQAPKTAEWEWPASPEGDLAALSVITPVYFKDVTAGYAAVSLNRAMMSQSLEEATRAIVLATVVMVLIGIVMSFVIGTRLSEPISDLMQASREMNANDQKFRSLERRNDEIGVLMSSFNKMARGLIEKRQVEQVFSRYVSSSVARQVLANLDAVELGGRRVKASVLFADIEGFTRLSEQMAPQAVADLLNEYFSYIAGAGTVYRGTLDKYMGDCAMLVFGVPEKDPDHGFHAVACAVLIQRLVAELNARRETNGLVPVHFRIGINSGEMLAGNMGSNDRMQYTVVGDAVNLASRLCSVAERGQIIVGPNTHTLRDVRTRTIGQRHQAIRLRGVSRPVNTYLIEDVTAPYRSRMDQELRELLDRGNEALACQGP
ncbi:MAG: HAMP domain-containing protein [Gammaproteobacteria bacterium]|nr:HAMP domain-containing protein [Gammaproteobacteria bacterium]NIR85876.1 HAMP domain-containing protein [Gammaproteobacteria bacterium]NIR90843.1 HAMP domain-containing protein [Gammaproteobacteria bacterium]